MKDKLEKQIAEACKDLFGAEVAVELTRPDEQFGDYSTNVALHLSKQLQKNPREIAETLAVKLRETSGKQISEITVAGPGFINLKLSDEVLIKNLVAKPAKTLDGQTVVAEYSDPNPFKVLHAGHLYTSVVGDAIANLMEQAGAKVYRINFGGDVGLHVAKTMWAVLKELGGENPEKLSSDVLKDLDLQAGWISKRYVEGNSAFDSSEEAKLEINALNKRVYKLFDDNDKDSPFAQIYWTCREWSYDYFEHFYKSIGVKPFDKYYPESETAPIGLAKVPELLDQGVLESSDGAVVFKGEKYDLHTRVFLTKEGLPTYETKDLGLIIAKKRDYNFDASVVITGNDIVEYMKVVLKVVEQFAPELSTASRHLTHGLVKLAGHEKMSSRKGNVLEASDIIRFASDAAKEIRDTPDDSKLNEIVFGAVKYAFLKQRLGGDIIYDPKESVSLEGNSGPYLQYAYARARSILRKSGENQPEKLVSSIILEEGERPLVRKIGEFAEVVDKAVVDLMPHHICSYLYELAQAFNRFYENNRVIGDDRQVIRLQLVEHYARTLQSGLDILSIAAPDKM